MNINQLPLETQNEVKSILGAYDRCTVYKKSGGEYYVAVHVSLHTGSYSEEVGEYFAHEVFTIEERIVNYVKNFKDFPFHCGNGLHYSGKMDWKGISSNWSDVKLVDGDLIFI